MHSRGFHRLLVAVFVGLLSLPAVAQFTKDKSATLKIDEAVNTHYFNGELDKAESLLKGIVDACGDKCSPQTKAKAWMYVGIVRGGGDNQGGAKEAFTKAKALDPAVQLDRDLASPETQATFDAVAGGTAPVAAPTPSAPSSEIPGDMVCTPAERALQTRSSIPISCTSAAAVESAELRFKEVGGDKWKKIAMEPVGEFWQAEIPCDLTGKAGDLFFYVGAKDAAGEYVDQYGSKKEPATVTLSESGAQAAFPGKTAAPRCAGSPAASDCPPDFPGCASSGGQCGSKEWGASCSASNECQCGLTCQNGACENAPSCSTDAECGDGGSCVSGKCQGGEASGDDGPVGEYKKFWVGVNAAIDLTLFGGAALCTAERAGSYNSYCFDGAGNPFIDTSPTPLGVNTGLALGQIRPMVAFDYALTDRLTVGLRGGVAIGGHPNPTSGTLGSFNLVHIEARGTYYFTSLAKNGLRPFAFLGVGYAAMDGKISAANGITIYKVAGNVMAAPGVGLAYAFTPQAQLGLSVGVPLFFPTFNFGVQPALSFTYGL